MVIMRNSFGLKRCKTPGYWRVLHRMKPKVQNVKLLEDFTSDKTKTAKRQVIGGLASDETKTSEGLKFFSFWKMMMSQEQQKY